MNRHDIAAVLFGLVGAGFLVRFAINPGLEAAAIFPVILGVGFLSLAATMGRRNESPTTESGIQPRVLATTIAAILVGISVYVWT